MARLTAAAIAGFLLVAGPASTQTISRMGLGLTLAGGSGGALDPIVSTPATAIYSFRKMRAAYTGAAVRLRRVDLAEQDIGFTGGGDFDTATATAFCAATSCFILIWYDQSGNGRDLGQPTAVNQPAYIASCIGALPCMSLTTATMAVQFNNVTPATGVVSFSTVANRSVGTGTTYMMRENGVANRLTAETANLWLVRGGTSGNVNRAANDNAWHAAQGVVNGVGSSLTIDGGTSTGTTTGNTTLGNSGNSGAVATTLLQTEIVYWDNYVLTPAEIAALDSNQRAYWGF